MSDTPLNDLIRRDLSQMAAEKQEYDEFFRVFKRRERNASVTELNKFLQNSELAPLRDLHGRKLAIEFFRRLERMRLGEFRVGRRKKATRFIWAVPLIDVAEAALEGRDSGSPASGESMPAPARSSARLLAHSYVLRENLVVKLELPLDLTVAEAKRLSTFIQTLPLDEGKGE